MTGTGTTEEARAEQGRPLMQVSQHSGPFLGKRLTLTRTHVEVVSRQVMRARTRSIELASIEGVYLVEGLGPAAAAVMGMATTLVIMLGLVLAERAGHAALPASIVGTGVVVAMALHALWTLCPSRYVLETRAGRQCWFFADRPTATEMVRFVELMQEMATRRQAEAQVGQPLDGIAQEIARLAALVETRQMTAEEFTLRKRVLLDFASGHGPGPDEGQPLH